MYTIIISIQLGFKKKTLKVCDFAEWIEKIIFSDLA
jgi:hypothetical protein